MSVFDSFLEIAGNLGFLVGDNDRRRERERKEKRTWGVEQDGIAISIAASSLKLLADETLKIEVALRNTTAIDRELTLGNWLRFFKLEILGPDNVPVPLTPFGRRQFEAAHSTPEYTITVKAGEVISADIPVGALYNLSQPGTYTIQGKSQASSAFSNELQIRL